MQNDLNETHQPDLLSINSHEVNSNNEIICRFCGGKDYTNSGTLSYTENGVNQKKQRYRCKSCGRRFVLGAKAIDSHTLKTSDTFNFDDDVWLSSHLALRVSPHINPRQKGKPIVFSSIKQLFLKQNVKRFILYKASLNEFTTITQDYLPAFRKFSDYLFEISFCGEMEDINRDLVIDYVNYLSQQKLSAKTKYRKLSVLSLFFETGIINNWFQVPSSLVRQEDYPKQVRPLPRYIPEEVMKQLNQYLVALPEPVMRMTLVLQECGLRIGELCQLRLDCLKSDGKNQWRIQFMRWKTKREDSIPISPELARVIQEQIIYINNNFGSQFFYLFCGRKMTKNFVPEPKVMTGESFIRHLKKIANDYQIKEKSGKIWNFQSHQFRHTVGTRMINNGVPQHIIQRYLGHESPTMTSVYAHIFDETLREEIEKYHASRVVNFQGETVELEETILSSNDDLEWFKKNVQARALEHGYCARPRVLGDCDIPGFDGCYSCPHWRTNKNFLPILIDTLERTNKVLEKACNCGWELQVKKNEPIQHNLEQVIKSLETEGNESKN